MRAMAGNSNSGAPLGQGQGSRDTAHKRERYDTTELRRQLETVELCRDELAASSKIRNKHAAVVLAESAALLRTEIARIVEKRANAKTTIAEEQSIGPLTKQLFRLMVALGVTELDKTEEQPDLGDMGNEDDNADSDTA